MQNKKVKVLNQVPIFPLPNLVFFPKTLLPLHIFEPRYRRMVEDAKSQENQIAMVLLKEGWEQDYFGNPEVHQVACVGQIQYSERVNDERYNILLYGLTRIKILRFVQHTPYRIAQVEHLRDTHFDRDEFNENFESESFVRLVRAYVQEIGVENIDELLQLQTHSLESIMNQVASILDFTAQEKQRLLEMDALEKRYEELTKLLKDKLIGLQVARKVKYVPEDPGLN